MASVLEFERYGKELERQLLRRIGYTNGLHKLRRFARIVDYLYPIMPTSVRQLAQVIIQEENAAGSNQLKGIEYATGIIDVTRALVLIERFGPKIALSSPGYACHALVSSGAGEAAVDAFLFEKVVQSDGEYTLNVLRLVSEGVVDVRELGGKLFERFLQLVDYKKEWAATQVSARFAQRSLLSLLTEAGETLRKAISKTGRLTEFFFKHTLNPRLEWLEDLGCLARDGSALVCSPRGQNVLNELKSIGAWHAEFVALPLDQWLSVQLDTPSMLPPGKDANFSWRLVASAVRPEPTTAEPPSNEHFLQTIKTIYRHIKLANFNEADGQSLYEVMAAIGASRGQVLPLAAFEVHLAELVREYPGEIFKLSKRRGQGLYIALKRSA
ncbi:MAG: hypothetical protein ACRD1M_04980 [Terriglobales bacterium]